jgi:hypothetical protein
MSIDGTYGFTYCGVNGLGIGVFTIRGGRLHGRDFGDGHYDGTATENPDGTIALSIHFDVAPGMMLVQGTAPQDVTHRRRISHVVPAAFGDGVPLEIPSPPGVVTVMVKRVPDEFAPAAEQGFRVELGSARASA